MEKSELLKKTVLDIVSEHESAVEIFNSYNEQAGECICCNALFEPVEEIIKKYKIDTEEITSRLSTIINNGTGV